jgi:hypothetical protein
MNWTNIISTFVFLVLVTGVRLQDKFIFKNAKQRDAAVAEAEAMK